MIDAKDLVALRAMCNPDKTPGDMIIILIDSYRALAARDNKTYRKARALLECIRDFPINRLAVLESAEAMQDVARRAIAALDIEKTYKPVSVVDEERATKPGERIKVLRRFATIPEAEAWIGARKDQAKVARGGYGIDAPESMINPGKESQ